MRIVINRDESEIEVYSDDKLLKILKMPSPTEVVSVQDGEKEVFFRVEQT